MRLEKPSGSSPRLRGTLKPVVLLRARGRFIPAPAGNAQEAGILNSGDSGSSPRLRGTRPPSPLPCLMPRFIPAPAGNAGDPLLDRYRHSVHPRACGERPDDEDAGAALTGSSPRLRGTQSWVFWWLSVLRFIPAPAGNAFGAMSHRRQWTVHPRACGERSRGGSPGRY